jgi:hypothetical protein
VSKAVGSSMQSSLCASSLGTPLTTSKCANQACCEAADVVADALPGTMEEKSRSEYISGAAHLKEASRVRSMYDTTAHSANELWESKCLEMLAICDGLMMAVATYSEAQQQALIRAFRAYIPKKDDSPTREALMQTEALHAFGEAIKAAVRAPESELVSEPVPPPHPMRGTPLPEVLHSGMLTRKNAFGSLFKAKQKSEARLAPTLDGPRDFDFSRNVERCDIFLSHSWGVCRWRSNCLYPLAACCTHDLLTARLALPQVTTARKRWLYSPSTSSTAPRPPRS